jgi:hypothetical protein
MPKVEMSAAKMTLDKMPVDKITRLLKRKQNDCVQNN